MEVSRHGPRVGVPSLNLRTFPNQISRRGLLSQGSQLLHTGARARALSLARSLAPMVDFLAQFAAVEKGAGCAPPIRRTPSGKQVPHEAEDGAEDGVDVDLSHLGLDEEAEPQSACTAESVTTLKEPSEPSVEEQTGTAISHPRVRKRASSEASAAERAAVIAKLRGAQFMHPSDPKVMHGWAYEGPMTAPKVLWASDKKPRKDHDAPEWLTATEYEDVPKVTDAKVKALAHLMRLSQHTCVYSGAGISASAVGQAALSGVNKVGWLNKTEAQPTLTHHALAVLGRTGWVHGWVQQNHDGYPTALRMSERLSCLPCASTAAFAKGQHPHSPFRRSQHLHSSLPPTRLLRAFALAGCRRRLDSRKRPSARCMARGTTRATRSSSTAAR